MAKKELKCPTCAGDLLLSGDEEDGDQVFCAACSAPAILRGNPKSENCEVEIDY